MGNTEDDFWNESSSSRFNIFDDDDALLEVGGVNSGLQENVILPIHSVISNRCLKINDIDSTVEYMVPPPEETIRRMFYGENIALNTYHTVENKLQLLDASLDVGDGNIIITVIIFLNKTLNNNIFFTQLSKRKVAVKHYVNYVIERNNLQGLADLYMATGNIFNLKDIYYLLMKEISNQSALYKKLDQFNIQNAQNLCCVEDKLEIQESMSFIEFQVMHESNNKSLIDQLITLCKSEWDKGCGDEAINDFRKQFKLDDFQFEWIIMNVLCKMKNWDKLVATFIKSVWVIKKRSLKSIIRPDLFILGMGRHNAPENITEQFLTCIGDTPKSLYLAEKLKLHMYVINYYIEQRDKTSLLKYMEKMEPESPPAIFLIQRGLNNTELKWKN